MNVSINYCPHNVAVGQMRLLAWHCTEDYFINQDCKDNKGGSWKAIPKMYSIFGEM